MAWIAVNSWHQDVALWLPILHFIHASKKYFMVLIVARTLAYDENDPSISFCNELLPWLEMCHRIKQLHHHLLSDKKDKLSKKKTYYIYFVAIQCAYYTSNILIKPRLVKCGKGEIECLCMCRMTNVQCMLTTKYIVYNPNYIRLINANKLFSKPFSCNTNHIAMTRKQLTLQKEVKEHEWETKCNSHLL